MNNKRSGIVAPLLIALIALLIIGAGYWFIYFSQKAPENTQDKTTQLTEEQLKNATYTLPYAITSNNGSFPVTITLQNGSYSWSFFQGKGNGAPNTTGHISFDKAVFGDLNNDGKNDAAVSLRINHGGNGSDQILAAFINDGGQPKTVPNTDYLGGAAITSMSISKGFIVLDVVDYAPGDSHCCPTLKKKLYYNLAGGATLVRTVLSEPADIATLTFDQIAKNNSGYSKNVANIYFEGKIIPGADPESFVLITGTLIKNPNWVYYDSGKQLEIGDQQFTYAKDSHAVYYRGNLVAGADPKTFEVIENGRWTHYYGKDKNNVYSGDLSIIGADRNTFKVLWEQIHEGCGLGEYTKDNLHVYYKDKPMAGVDVATFTPLINDYGKDKNSVFLKGIVQPGLNPTTFKVSCNYG